MINIEVYANFNTEYNLIGYLDINNERGHIASSFSFSDEFLKNKKLQFVIDPEIAYYNGPQWTQNKTGLFKIFEDTCPDRWGRKLIDRREKKYAEVEKRAIKNLNEIDYMLGVNDECRIGCFRYKYKGEKDFLPYDDEVEVPPITSLRELEDASFSFEKNDDNNEWLKQLVVQGSSLGGARPKANVKDEKGVLYIAKFPSINDEVDMGLLEKSAVDLAKICGINVPDTMIKKISDKGSIFLAKRFDRVYKDNEVKRLFYMSAMTALNKNDGDTASYLDIVSFIRENSSSVNKDLEELYKRLIFNILIHNTDDHLRNYAFICIDNKLTLSPAYDLTPNIYNPTNLSLNIDEYNSDLSLDLALSTCKYYGLDNDKAKGIIDNMKNIVKTNATQFFKKYII